MLRPLHYLFAASLAATILMPAGIAAAAPPAALASASIVAPATNTAPVTITLITGDQVQVTAQPDGRSAVAVVPRAGALTQNFNKHEVGGHTYVVPADVAALVPTKLDWALFDVTLLAQRGIDDASLDAVPVDVDAVAGSVGAVALPDATVTSMSGSTSTMAVDKAGAAELGAALAAAAVAAPGTASVLDGIAQIRLSGVAAGTSGPSTQPTGEQKTVTLTVNGIARDGRPAFGISSVDVINVDDQSIYRVIGAVFTDGTSTFSVPTGHYAVLGYIFTYDEPQVYATEAAATFLPEINIKKNTTVTLDARDSVPIQIDTKDPVEATSVTLSYWRQDAVGFSYEHSYTVSNPINKMFANPTDAISIGNFEFYSQHSLIAPDIAAKVIKPQQRPIDADYVFSSAKLDGTFKDQMVYVGLGRVEDYAGLNVKNKVVLIQRGEITFLEKMQNATAAGAQLAMIYNNVPGLLLISGDPTLIPTMSMTQSEGEALKALTDAGKVTVQLDAVAVSPYLYDLVLPEPGQIPPVLHYVVDDTTSATMIVTYRGHEDAMPVGELRQKFRPWEFSSFGFLRQMPVPLKRTEYITAGDTTYQQYFWGYSTVASPFNLAQVGPLQQFTPGQHLTDSWLTQTLAPAAAPAAAAASDSAAYRSGDTLVLNVPEWVDPAGHWGFADPLYDTTAFRLYQDGDQVGSGAEAVGSYAVDPGASTLRLELDAARTAPGWLYSTSTATKWTVKSDTTASPERLPLLNVTFAANLNTLDQLSGGKKGRALGWTVAHQAGSDDSAITGSKLWVSYDQGGTWKKVKHVKSGGGGDFSVKLPKAPPSATDVSLRVSGSDADGGMIQQDILSAFGLGK